MKPWALDFPLLSETHGHAHTHTHILYILRNTLQPGKVTWPMTRAQSVSSEDDIINNEKKTCSHGTNIKAEFQSVLITTSTKLQDMKSLITSTSISEQRLVCCQTSVCLFCVWLLFVFMRLDSEQEIGWLSPYLHALHIFMDVFENEIKRNTKLAT